jgi:transposase InsO family protein
MFELALVPFSGRHKRKTEKWREDFNGFRPHSSLSDLTPNIKITQRD